MAESRDQQTATTSTPSTFHERMKSAHPSPTKDVHSLTCPTCDKVFSRVDHRRRHELIHSDKRPHECHYCEFASTRSDKLNQHLRRKHALMEEPSYSTHSGGPSKSKKSKKKANPSASQIVASTNGMQPFSIIKDESSANTIAYEDMKTIWQQIQGPPP